jgi:hypothetical protein
MSRRSSIMVQRTYYQIGMFTLFTVLLWVSVSVYLALVGSADVGVEKDLLITVPATPDQTTVASISARRQIGTEALTLVKDIVPATASAQPNSTPRPSITPSPSPSAVASSSAQSEASDEDEIIDTSADEF